MQTQGSYVRGVIGERRQIIGLRVQHRRRHSACDRVRICCMHSSDSTARWRHIYMHCRNESVTVYSDHAFELGTRSVQNTQTNKTKTLLPINYIAMRHHSSKVRDIA